MPYGRYTGRKRKRNTYRKGYDRQVGYYGRNKKRRKYTRSNTNGGGHVEKKFHDRVIDVKTITQIGSFLSSTGAETVLSTSINDIPQGPGEEQRIGRKCTITRVQMNITFEFLPALSATLTEAQFSHETVRMMVYWDKQCNGTAMTATQMLEVDEYNSFFNLANSGRFAILYDKTWAWNTTCIAASVATPNNQSERVVAVYNKKIDIPVFIPIEYSDTTGALTNIKSNNIGVILWSAHGARITTKKGRIRLRYIDY